MLCDQRCGQTIRRRVACINLDTGEVQEDEAFFCANAGEKPPANIECPKCDQWIIKYGQCQYSSVKKSCRPSEGKQPFVYECPSGNCGPMPKLPTEAELPACTMACQPYTRTEGPCLNEPPYDAYKCKIGQPKHFVKHSCDFDNGNPDVCTVFPPDGPEDCNTLPECLDWEQTDKYPGATCRNILNVQKEQKCGEGLNHYNVICPEANRCNPYLKPNETEPCRETVSCAWVAEEISGTTNAKTAATPFNNRTVNDSQNRTVQNKQSRLMNTKTNYTTTAPTAYANRVVPNPKMTAARFKNAK
jgi:hypothetical protein